MPEPQSNTALIEQAMAEMAVRVATVPVMMPQRGRLESALGDLRIAAQSVMLENEALKRELDYLRNMLEEQNGDDDDDGDEYA